MKSVNSSLYEFREADDLSGLSSPVHSIHPLAKFIVTVVYIWSVTSFSKYDISGLFPMTVFPVMLFQLSGISVGTCFRRMRTPMQLVCVVGALEPFFAKEPVFFGNFTVRAGIISMVTIMLKGILCLMAAFLLISTTSFDSLCASFRVLHMPDLLVMMFLLTYRYISLMLEDVETMETAYLLRAPGQNGIHYKAWGSFLGQLFLRSIDRAEEMYSAMQLRGFDGDLRYARVRKADRRDILFAVSGIVLVLSFRAVNISVLLGRWFV